MENFIDNLIALVTIDSMWKVRLGFGIVFILLMIAVACMLIFSAKVKQQVSTSLQEQLENLKEWSESAEDKRRMDAEMEALRRGEMQNTGRIAKFDILMRQSGILSKYPGLNTELFLIIWGVAIAVVTFLALVITRGIIPTLLAFVVISFIPYIGISALAKYKMGKVKEMLLIFCDTAINLSATNTNLMELLRQTGGFMDDPLKTALLNAYNEALASGGGQWLALYHLRQHIPEEQFSATIQDLELASRYEANYQQVLKDRKAIIETHMTSESKKKQLLNGGRLNIGIMLFVCYLCINALQDLVEGGIWNLLLTTPVGLLIMALILAVVLYALKVCFTTPQI